VCSDCASVKCEQLFGVLRSSVDREKTKCISIAPVLSVSSWAFQRML